MNALVAAMGKVVPVKEPFPRITVGPGLMNPEGLAAIMLALNGQSILGREHRNPMGRRGYALAGGLYPSGSTFPGSGTVPSAG